MEDYIGIIKLFAGTFAPRGWAFCHGQDLEVHRYNNLFSIIGTTYGGDGGERFTLPDLRGRTPLGAGSGGTLTAYAEGAMGGTENAKLDATHLPDHTHTAKAMASTSNAVDSTPKRTSVLAAPGKGIGRAFDASFGFIDATPDIQLADTTIVVDSTTGGGKEFSIKAPFLALNYIICLEGIYPPRP